jgi:hypothetical protein
MLPRSAAVLRRNAEAEERPQPGSMMLRYGAPPRP